MTPLKQGRWLRGWGRANFRPSTKLYNRYKKRGSNYRVNVNKEKFWEEANLGPTRTKRQHYVPELLLRTFTTDDKIRVFDLDYGQEYRTSIVNAAIENHFYDESISDFHLSTEDWLANNLEDKAAPIIKRLIDNPDSIVSLSIEEEFHISRFLAALRFRTPAFRNHIEKFSTIALSKIKDMANKQIYHQHDKGKADTIWKEMENKPDHWWFNEQKPQRPASITNFMLGEIPGFANSLRAAPWRIGTTPNSLQLYTSDNPVSEYLRPVRPSWETARFSSMNYFIPLSPKTLIIIEHRPYQQGNGELQTQGERRHADFSEWEISFARHVITNNAVKYLYGEGSVVSRECASSCLERIGHAQLDFAIRYLGFDP